MFFVHTVIEQNETRTSQNVNVLFFMNKPEATSFSNKNCGEIETISYIKYLSETYPVIGLT